MIKTNVEYRAEWGYSMAAVKKGCMFYLPNVDELYKEGALVKRFNVKLNTYRLYPKDD